MSEAGLVLGIILILVPLLIFAVSIVFYVLGAIGLSTIAKNRGMDDAWFAWLPFFDLYLIGELIGNELWGTKGAKWILALFPLINIFISSTGIFILLGLILDVVYFAYMISAFYKLFRIYAPNYALIYTIFFFFNCIWFFVIRNNAPVGLRFYNKDTDQILERPFKKDIRINQMKLDPKVFEREERFKRPAQLNPRRDYIYNPSEDEPTEPLLGREEK